MSRAHSVEAVTPWPDILTVMPTASPVARINTETLTLFMFNPTSLLN
jgi:hypothetical protein